jgi:PPOX class probable F420-dependent enzyme
MAIEPADFIAERPRAVLITHRRDGGLQASPVRFQRDGEGRIVASTRATTAKARNIVRDPRVTLCVVDNGWSGPWMTIEGHAEVVALPDALPALRAFYLQRDGSVPSEEQFVAQMAEERRVLLVVHPERHTTPAGLS